MAVYVNDDASYTLPGTLPNVECQNERFSLKFVYERVFHLN
jgi:hypothetical protein